ncbi:MAG TPA: hypothetical protein V6D07_18865 [Trichocoleus sp.]
MINNDRFAAYKQSSPLADLPAPGVTVDTQATQSTESPPESVPRPPVPRQPQTQLENSPSPAEPEPKTQVSTPPPPLQETKLKIIRTKLSKGTAWFSIVFKLLQATAFISIVRLVAIAIAASTKGLPHFVFSLIASDKAIYLATGLFVPCLLVSFGYGMGYANVLLELLKNNFDSKDCDLYEKRFNTFGAIALVLLLLQGCFLLLLLNSIDPLILTVVIGVAQVGFKMAFQNLMRQIDPQFYLHFSIPPISIAIAGMALSMLPIRWLLKTL